MKNVEIFWESLTFDICMEICKISKTENLFEFEKSWNKVVILLSDVLKLVTVKNYLILMEKKGCWFRFLGFRIYKHHCLHIINVDKTECLKMIQNDLKAI